jgi:DNA-binding transcriptional ArsR family regulator
VPSKDPLDRVFMALADPTRRALVHRLTAGEQPMGVLAAGFDISLAAVSKHVKVLEAAGLVHRRVDGRTHWIELAPEQLTGALDWISIYRNFWHNRLQALARHVDNNED